MFGQMYFTNLVEVFNYITTTGKIYKVLTSDNEVLLHQAGGAMAVEMGHPYNDVCVVVHTTFWEKISHKHLMALLGHEVGHLENCDLTRKVGSIKKEYDADIYALTQGVAKIDLITVLFICFMQIMKNWTDLSQLKTQLGHNKVAYATGMTVAIVLYPLNLIGFVWLISNYLIRAIPIMVSK
jgi:hypothetical protein